MTVEAGVALVVFLASILVLARAIGWVLNPDNRKASAARKWWRWVAVLLAVAALPVCGNSLLAVPLIRAGLGPTFGHPSLARVSAPSLVCRDMEAFAYRIVDPDGREDPHAGADDAVRCSIQTVVNDGGSPGRTQRIPASACWPSDLAAARTTVLPLCYRLGFLEFDEAGRLLDPYQLPRLKQLYRGGREVYTIAYIHGWRHDARVGDKDVRRLRVAAAYASAHLQERCRLTGFHCGAEVLAVYIGWPGAIGLLDGDSAAYAFANILTFSSRKNLSDTLGASVLERLSDLYRDSRSAGTNPANRTLLIGHSLGGNMILTAASRGMIDAFVRTSRELRSGNVAAAAADHFGLPADLTVLLNPASEVAKLATIREAEFRVFATSASQGDEFARFPDGMPPKLVILSAGCRSLQLGTPSPDDANVKCDKVVGTAFRISQFVEGRWGLTDSAGIGHIPIGPSEARSIAPRLMNMTVETNYQARGLPGFYGSSRFAGSGIEPWFRWNNTSYSSARDRLMNTCFPEPAWLLCARRGVRPDRSCRTVDRQNRWAPWTAGDGSRGETTLNLVAETGLPGQTNVQFAYGLKEKGAKATLRVPVAAQRADPLWATQADLSAVADHSQVASAPVLCALNKLVLDDVTSTWVGFPRTYHDRNRMDWETRAGTAILRRREATTAADHAWSLAHPG